MNLKPHYFAAIITAGLPTSIFAGSFDGFVNLGLVGVGRLPANSLDSTGSDTLGGLFSSMAVSQKSLQYSGGTFSGVLFGLPDRGFGDGAQDYHPRIQKLDFTFTPATGAGPFAQDQISIANTGTKILTDGHGQNFTGFNPDATFTSYPKSAPGSLGAGKASLDPEGLVRLPKGGWLVSDEYGPSVLRFNNAGQLIGSLPLPAALIPEKPAGTVNYDGNISPASGRRGNRGMEGLSLSPDGNTLFAMLQSPLVQDGGLQNGSLYTRVLRYDLTPGAATEGQLTGEFVYQLAKTGTRHDPQSEILALNDHQFLVIERDNRGLGAGGAPAYKKVNVGDLTGASNILGTGYDLGVGDAGQLNLPLDGTLPNGLTSVTKSEFVDLLDLAELNKFGLNINATPDQNSLSEKWEGLGLIPALDTKRKDDFYLFVGNDNDFNTGGAVIHNGVSVGTSSTPIDTMLLAYHVVMPGASTSSVPDGSAIPVAEVALGLGLLAVWRRQKRND